LSDRAGIDTGVKGAVVTEEEAGTQEDQEPTATDTPPEKADAAESEERTDASGRVLYPWEVDPQPAD
jgi:hypothetical protein